MKTYQIDPRPVDLGGGWRLRLLEEGEEMGGGVFPLAEYAALAESDKARADLAYADALEEGEAWQTNR
jgi:hypothetical protein